MMMKLEHNLKDYSCRNKKKTVSNLEEARISTHTLKEVNKNFA